MKRKLSLLLAVVMILGSFSFAFAAEETAAEKAGAFLKEVGVLEGINGDLKLEDNLRRQDAVVLVARLHGAEDKAKAYSPEGLKFTDFTDPYYRPIIKWAVDEGLFVGHTEERFGFNEDVTAQQYATVLLRALGYNDKVATDEGYAKALEEAKALGILEGLEVENATVVTRGLMAEMTFNALGAKMKDSDKTLAEFLGIEMPKAEKLEIVEVKADNLGEVIIVLNDASLIKDKAAVLDARNYRTNAGEVVNVEIDGNDVVLALDKVMEQNRKYDLTTRYIKDFEISRKEFKAYDNDAPVVVDVEVLGPQGVRVRMSEPVKVPDQRDIKLDGKHSVMEIKQYNHAKRELLLLPYYAEDLEVGEHTLEIGQITDLAGFKSKMVEQKIVVEEKEDLPEIADIVVRNNEVIVEFTNYVFPKSVKASNVAWVQDLTGRVIKEASGFEILTGKKVKYTFGSNAQLPKPRVTLTIKGLENYSGKVMKDWTETVAVEVDFTNPEIVDWRLIDGPAMELEFNKALDKKQFEDVSKVIKNFELLDSDEDVIKYAVRDAELSDNGKVVTVSFRKGDLVKGEEYTLVVKDLRDNTSLGNYMVVARINFKYGIGDYLEVNYVKTHTTKINGKDRIDKIVIGFNDQLDRRSAEDLSNYEFIVQDEIDNADITYMSAHELSARAEARLLKDGKEVEIVLPNNGRNIIEIRLGLAIKSKDGNNRVNEDYRTLDLYKPYLKATKATIAKEGTTIEVEFNQPIVQIDTIDTTKILVDGTTVKSATVNSKGNLVLTIEENLLTYAGNTIKIQPGAGIKGEYDRKAPVEETVIFKAYGEIVEKRPLVVTEAKFDLDKDELTVKTNRNATSVQKDIEIFDRINHKVIIKLDKANSVIDNGREFTIKEFSAKQLETLRTAVLEGKAVVRYADNADVVISYNKAEDKADLTAAIAAADEKVEADYTEESWTAFQTALTAALELPELTQAEVDAKVAAINAAIEELVEKDGVITLESLNAEITSGVAGSYSVLVTLENLQTKFPEATTETVIILTIGDETIELEYDDVDEGFVNDDVQVADEDVLKAAIVTIR